MFNRVILGILVVTLLGCFSTEVPEVQVEDNDPIKHEDVTLETRDGVKIAACYFPAKDLKSPRPFLILVHGSNKTKERWEEMGVVERLASENYHLLAIDIRGRGESEFGDEDALRNNPGLAIYDIEAALDWATKQPSVDPENVALVGSSYGANLVVSGCLSQDWNIKTVVCFSATAASYRMRKAFSGENKIPSGLYLGGRNEPERYAISATAGKLIADTAGAAMVQIHNDPAHALTIWHHHPESRDLVVNWLKDRFSEQTP